MIKTTDVEQWIGLDWNVAEGSYPCPGREAWKPFGRSKISVNSFLKSVESSNLSVGHSLPSITRVAPVGDMF